MHVPSPPEVALVILVLAAGTTNPALHSGTSARSAEPSLGAGTAKPARAALTADKVAIRVSILVQFRVTDPKAAIHTVDNFEDRLYSDVQLAEEELSLAISYLRRLNRGNRNLVAMAD